jgi:hypothetical protein
VSHRFRCSLGFIAALLAACGGGGGGADTSNPTAACNSYASAVCNKAQACGANGVTAQCGTQLQTALDCAHLTCPAGSTFDSGAASQCIDAINGLSCTEAANDFANGPLPAACNRVCH